ncbi:hypothetical protein [Ancylomarina longa]|uniref:Uncharacterized protein n=1 Tax=Ancylomarina longa TaxID=2487017 RepID=A0A434ATE8_9BACT|nr:hypothetical protein [Ancylomarina longa]RUT77629.1 hypothetical protein DLK05_11905 [Ancylomarina longa]
MKKINLLMKNHRGFKFGITCTIIVVCLFGMDNTVFSQETKFISNGNSVAAFGGKIIDDTAINEIPYRKQLVGSFYLDPSWKKSDVYLVRDSVILQGIYTRLDVRNNAMEIKYKDQVKILPTYRIRSVVYSESKSLFVTESVLKSTEQGFYKVVVDNNNSLLCRYNAKIKTSNYNVTLDTGKRDDHIIKELSFYLYNKEKLLKLESTKKKFKKQFEANSNVKLYLNNHKINPKKEVNLVQFVQFLNIKSISL